MPHEVYVFGDSHWRVYFPFLNTGSPGVCHEEDGIITLDTTANELSGATMYGLLNEGSRNGARKRIIRTLDEYGPVENVGLVFGEVDLRYHYDRYFRDGTLYMPAVLDVITGYRKFVEDELLRSGRVTGKVFWYYGFRYSQAFVDSFGENYKKVQDLNLAFETLLSGVKSVQERSPDPYWDRIVTIVPGKLLEQPGSDLISDRYVDDGVHMNPNIYRDFILPAMTKALNG